MTDGIALVRNEAGLAAKPQTMTEEAEKNGVPGARVSEYLLSLNPSRRRQIEQLLDWKYCQCETVPDDQPKNCYETAAFVTGLDFISRRRVQAERNGPILDEQDEIAKMLAAGGYLKVAQAFIFRVGKEQGKPEETIIGINLSSLPKNLKPGDIMLFGGRGLNSQGQEVDRYIHAMVYLGGYQSRYYVMEKPSWDCGAASPYQIISLGTILGQMIGLAAGYNNIYTDRVFVLRKP